MVKKKNTREKRSDKKIENKNNPIIDFDSLDS